MLFLIDMTTSSLAITSLIMWYDMSGLKKLVDKTAQFEVLFITPKQLRRFRTLLPFMWLACLVLVVSGPVYLTTGWLEDHTVSGWILICSLINLFYIRESREWYRYWKNSDDDFWKKKRKRAADKIREVAGKLVPTPAPIPVPVRA